MAENNEAAQKAIPAIIEGIGQCKGCPVNIHLNRGIKLIGQKVVADILSSLLGILFPGCHGNEDVQADSLEQTLLAQLRKTANELERQIAHSFAYESAMSKSEDNDIAHLRRAEGIVERLIISLPEIQSMLRDDIMAAYENDPASKSTMEVVLSYPGFKAVVAHRIAHVLHLSGVPLIPRMMSEDAHSSTGIDIHPGATIGRGFFIDHGTGVVIGETCVIGEKVKIYQGVTLGALSFPIGNDGNPIKGIKRHPNVEKEVTIYGGATILGNVSIGKSSVIGGNVWLTHSVPAFSKVYNRQPTPLIKQSNGQWEPLRDQGAGI